MSKHPDATIIATVSEITATNVVTTTQMSVKGNQTKYLGCTVLPSGRDVVRKILDVLFEFEFSEAPPENRRYSFLKIIFLKGKL